MHSLALFAGILAAVANAQIPPTEAPVRTQYTVRYADIQVGTGPRAEPGQLYVFHCTIWLSNGKKVVSTRDRGTPYRLEQGARKLMSGLDAGFEDMHVGGKRRLFIPYQLAAGEKGGGPFPPKMDLVYDIELLEVRDSFPAAPAPAGVRYEGISQERPTGSSGISPQSLVAAFDMSTLTADGRLRDFSGKGNDGAIHGTETVAGLFGAARRFKVATDRIALQSSPVFAIDGPLSIAAWVRLARGGLHQHVLACDDKFAFWFTEGDKFRFVDSTGHGFQSTGSISTGEWHSIVGVFRGTRGDLLTAENIKLYVDGAEMLGSRATAWQPGVLHPSDACYIGFESHQGTKDHQAMFFDGDIDEVLVFSRALSEQEVAAHAARR